MDVVLLPQGRRSGWIPGGSCASGSVADGGVELRDRGDLGDGFRTSREVSDTFDHVFVESLAREVPSWTRDELTTEWLLTTAGEGQGPEPQRGQVLRGILEDLTVPHRDIDAALRIDARMDRHPAVTALRQRSAGVLLRHLGQSTTAPLLPTFNGTDDPVLRYFWVLVFADMQPHVSAWHAEQGIGSEVSRRTLADLGRQMTHNRRRFGYGGLTLNIDWLCTHFQGQLYQLGRLQFEMTDLGRTTASEIASSGRPAAVGDPALAVHVPDYSGPFTPSDCRASFALAGSFFAQHFPHFMGEVMTCHSWLLDRRLPIYLAPESNIVAFQRLFTITHREQTEDDATLFDSIFGTRDISDLDGLPQATSLQRAMVNNLRDGHHWYGGVGWRPIEA